MQKLVAKTSANKPKNSESLSPVSKGSSPNTKHRNILGKDYQDDLRPSRRLGAVEESFDQYRSENRESSLRHYQQSMLDQLQVENPTTQSILRHKNSQVMHNNKIGVYGKIGEEPLIRGGKQQYLPVKPRNYMFQSQQLLPMKKDVNFSSSTSMHANDTSVMMSPMQTGQKQLHPSLYSISKSPSAPPNIAHATLQPLPQHSQLVWPAHIVNHAVMGLDRLEQSITQQSDVLFNTIDQMMGQEKTSSKIDLSNVKSHSRKYSMGVGYDGKQSSQQVSLADKVISMKQEKNVAEPTTMTTQESQLQGPEVTNIEEAQKLDKKYLQEIEEKLTLLKGVVSITQK